MKYQSYLKSVVGFFFLLMTLLSMQACSKEYEGRGILFKLGEYFLSFEGCSYTAKKEEYDKLVKENFSLKEEMKSLNQKQIQEKYKSERVIETTKTEPPVTGIFFKAYSIDKIKGKLTIDSCLLNDDGQPTTSPYLKPKELYLSTSKGVFPINYKGDSESIYEVCDSKIKRALWNYTFDKKDLGDNYLITTSKNIQFTAIDLSIFKNIQVNEKEIIMNYVGVKPSECKMREWGKYKILTCGDQFAELIYNNQTLLKSEPGGYGDAFINLNARVVVDGIEYFYVSYGIKGSTDEKLISKDGEVIRVESCYLPTMC